MRFYLKKIRTFIKIVTTNGFETSFNLGLIYFIWPLFVGFIPAYIRVYKKLKNLKLRFSINKEMVKWESKIEEILKSARVGYQMSVEDLVLDQDQLEIIKRDLSTSDEVVIGEIDQDGFFLSDIGPIHGLPSISESEFLKRKRFRVQIVVLRGIVGVRKSFRGDKISFLNEIVALYRLNLCSCNVPAILNVNFQFLTVTSSFIAGTGLRKKLSEAGAKLLDRDVINDANFMRLSEKGVYPDFSTVLRGV